VKKSIFYILLIAFLVFVYANTTSAFSSFGRVFGGRIISPKALQITGLEASGFICPMFGTSISIFPIGSPAGTPLSYFIPPYITSKTRTIPRSGQLIIGKYSSPMVITCTSPYPPFITIPVTLNTIILFGTSK